MYQIDNQSRQAVYEQIVRQVEKYVLIGVLCGGDKMPSVRNLSIQLNVNPNTVQRAYTELERAGVLVTAPGRGAYVSEQGAALLKERRREMSLSELKSLVAELKLAGLEKNHVLEIVERAYQEENHD
ncbi:MAG: GntR family transcriptional regulator [Oscillospiraceae bacterium]|nr:GntR family transcriptional regulator [Oscillospiraceae bacterium]